MANGRLPFKDVQFMSAGEKRNVLRAWNRFISNGFKIADFTQALYSHLIQHSNFITHYDRGQFHETYFDRPEDTLRFLDQFDRAKRCQSVENGDSWWLNKEDYADINNAMVDALAGKLPTIRQSLSGEELADARIELEAAQAKVNRLVAAPEECGAVASVGSERRDACANIPRDRG